MRRIARQGWLRAKLRRLRNSETIPPKEDQDLAGRTNQRVFCGGEVLDAAEKEIEELNAGSCTGGDQESG